MYDIVIRNGYLADRDAVVDIAVDNGNIVTVSSDVSAEGAKEIDAGGDLVSPGFVDCHVHIDRAFASAGERTPCCNDIPFHKRDYNKLFDEYYKNITTEELKKRAVENIQRAAAKGTTQLRTHICVDHPIGTETMEACLYAKEQTEHLVDLQLVPGGYRGIANDRSEQLVREALEMGLDHPSTDDSDVLLGGIDPTPRNHDIENTIDTWFEVATDYDVDMDIHIQEGGNIGTHTLERLAAKAEQNDYVGRVVASHSFSLAEAPDWRLDELIEQFGAVDINIVTCYSSTRCSMPIRSLVEGGIIVGHGTDNDEDFVLQGQSDTLVGLLIECFKLHGKPTVDSDFRWYESNDGLSLLWGMATADGANVLNLADYGIEEGTPGNLIVFDEPSPQWAIIRQANRSKVIKNGTVVAEDGELLPEQTVVDWSP